jgi:hypothetical protein
MVMNLLVPYIENIGSSVAGRLSASEIRRACKFVNMYK